MVNQTPAVVNSHRKHPSAGYIQLIIFSAGGQTTPVKEAGAAVAGDKPADLRLNRRQPGGGRIAVAAAAAPERAGTRALDQLERPVATVVLKVDAARVAHDQARGAVLAPQRCVRCLAVGAPLLALHGWHHTEPLNFLSPSMGSNCPTHLFF